MMLTQIISTLVLFIQLIQCVPNVKLFARSNIEGPIELGTIAFNETSGLASIVDIPEDLMLINNDVRYCVGVSTAGQFQCHSYVKLSLPLKYDIILHTKPTTGDLVSISVVRSETNGLNAIIKPAFLAQEPIAKDSTIKTKEITNDNGEIEIVHDEEETQDNRSFIQKYWMYIVGGLLLNMVMSGSSSDEEEKK